MKMNKGLPCVFLCLLVTMLPHTSRGQTASEIEISRSIIQAKRQEVLLQTLNLSADQSEAFLPLYREYQNEMAKINDRMLNLTQDIERSAGEITDEQASTMLDEFIKFQKSKLDLQKKYLGKLKKALPATLVARFFQMENRMDAAVQYGLMGSVPLVK